MLYQLEFTFWFPLSFNHQNSFLFVFLFLVVCCSSHDDSIVSLLVSITAKNGVDGLQPLCTVTSRMRVEIVYTARQSRYCKAAGARRVFGPRAHNRTLVASQHLLPLLKCTLGLFPGTPKALFFEIHQLA